MYPDDSNETEQYLNDSGIIQIDLINNYGSKLFSPILNLNVDKLLPQTEINNSSFNIDTDEINAQFYEIYKYSSDFNRDVFVLTSPKETEEGNENGKENQKKSMQIIHNIFNKLEEANVCFQENLYYIIEEISTKISKKVFFDNINNLEVKFKEYKNKVFQFKKKNYINFFIEEFKADGQSKKDGEFETDINDLTDIIYDINYILIMILFFMTSTKFFYNQLQIFFKSFLSIALFTNTRTNIENQKKQFISFCKDILKFFLDKLNKKFQTDGKKYDLKQYIKDYFSTLNEEAINDIFTDLLKIQKSESQDKFVMPKTTDIFYSTLLSIANHHIPFEPKVIVKLVETIIQYYQNFLSASTITKIYIDFIQIFTYNGTFAEIIEMLINSKKFYSVDILYQIIIDNLICQKQISENFFKEKTLYDEPFTSNDQEKTRYKYYDIKSQPAEFTETFFSFTPMINKDLEFYGRISYHPSMKKECIDREKNIFRRKYLQADMNLFENEKEDAKFIIKMHDEDSKSSIIPYFPLGTISLAMPNYINIRKNDKKGSNSNSNSNSSDVSDNKLSLTIVDKIVIIMEIADALKGLHKNDLFHGNLWNQSVYLSAKKDAYLTFFSYQKNSEFNDTKAKGPLYYRAPEKLDEEDKFDDSLHDETYISYQKKGDIYSFGVLIHAILTEVKPENMFGNCSRDLRVKIIRDDYSNFIFKCGFNECFEDDLISEFKPIILRCMDKTPDDRFTIDKLIESIKELQIYKDNKEEIEFRIKNATNSSEYKCTLADIVKCVYRGSTSCTDLIQKLITEHLNDDKFQLKIDDDIIQKIYEAFNIKNDDKLSLKVDEGIIQSDSLNNYGTKLFSPILNLKVDKLLPQTESNNSPSIINTNYINKQFNTLFKYSRDFNRDVFVLTSPKETEEGNENGKENQKKSMQIIHNIFNKLEEANVCFQENIYYMTEEFSTEVYFENVNDLEIKFTEYTNKVSQFIKKNYVNIFIKEFTTDGQSKKDGQSKIDEFKADIDELSNIIYDINYKLIMILFFMTSAKYFYNQLQTFFKSFLSIALFTHTETNIESQKKQFISLCKERISFFSSKLDKKFQTDGEKHDLKQYIKDYFSTLNEEAINGIFTNLLKKVEFVDINKKDDKSKIQKSESQDKFVMPKTTDIFYSTLLSIANHHIPFEPKVIVKLVETIIQYYQNFLSASTITKIYIDFIQIFTYNGTFAEIIEMLINSKKFYSVDILYQIIIDNLICQKQISENFFKEKTLYDEPFTSNDQEKTRYKYYDIKSQPAEFTETFFSFTPMINKDLEFYGRISYHPSMKKECIDREKSIFRRKYLQADMNLFENEKEDAKFIIKMHDEDSKSSIIPYFPLGTISLAMPNYINIRKNDKKGSNSNSNSNSNSSDVSDNKLSLTIVDKIVIIMEIADALKGLHKNDLFHGNLWNQSVYLSAKKDAYLTFFSYQKNSEFNDTKAKGPLYYRAPEKLDEEDKFDDSLHDEAYISYQKKGDIYSFGVLIHAILTEVKPENMFGNCSRDLRVKIIRDDYSNFIFKCGFNECFEDDLISEFKPIILRCMDKTPDDRFTIDKLIESIKELQIYKDNKEEIEFRIKNATNSSEYKCTLADIVKCVYRGSTSCTDLIQKLITEHLNDDKFQLKIDDDIIQKIYEAFDIKNDDFFFRYTTIYDILISKYHFYQISSKSISICYSDELLAQSLKTNENSIFPFFTLRNFIEFSEFNEEESLMFSYFIAREISSIHSQNMYHGNISFDSIAVYFNVKTGAFVPAIVPYYIYYKSFVDSRDFNRNYSLDTLDKHQRKDVKAFKSVISNFKYFPKNYLKEIEGLDDFGSILYYLHRKNIDIGNMQRNIFLQNTNNYDYSYFKVTFNVIRTIYFIFKQKIDGQKETENNYISIDININIDGIFDGIIYFLKRVIDDIQSPLVCHLPEMVHVVQNSILNLHSITEKFIIIYNLSSKLYNEFAMGHVDTEMPDELTFYDENNMFGIRMPAKQPKTVEPIKMHQFLTKKRRMRKQDRIWFNKMLIRRVEISELCFPSFIMMMRRYLLGLDPRLNFKIIIKISNKTYSKRQDKPIKASDVINVAKDLGIKNAEVEDGNVIIKINNNKGKKSKKNNNDDNNNDANDNGDDNNDDDADDNDDVDNDKT
ncbi:hypothetical protein M9Y10_044141 [Tritrichomonas musculus]|uniref:Protein kinase domain-containing protein n=1 Tax=Tritrichomonas musculus TaxID=1915356 RepID=A0ABR2K288_9EUKA